MANRCRLHPGREAVLEYGGQSYCAQCRDGQAAARRRVDRHVEPKDCFVWHLGGDNWSPIPGTGCAHWVAHKKSITSSAAGKRCMLGFPLEVARLTIGLSEVADIRSVQVGDLYITPPRDHCGLVSRIVAPVGGGTPGIEIEHDSSRQGRVSRNDFNTYFQGRGYFYR
jgi:hypothetical protein